MWWSAPEHPNPRTPLHSAGPGTCGPLEAETEVGVVTVLAGAPMAAGLAVALIDVGLAMVARVARLAQAGEGSDAVLAGPIVAGVGVALVNVHLAVGPRVACRAGAGAQGSCSLPTRPSLPQDSTTGPRSLAPTWED